MTHTHLPGTLIGLTGKLGAGKDMVLKRLQEVHGASQYERVSFADPLKKSAAALFGLTVPQLEAMKNEPSFRVSVVNIKGFGQDLGRSMSIREMLQRYGTEAHRDVFGDDFWVRVAIEELATRDQGPTYVFTDVRFDNEAHAIIEAGGRIYEVVGPNQDTGDHVSESGIAAELISGQIDNTTRPDYTAMTGDIEEARHSMEDSISHLDDEIQGLHEELLVLRAESEA